MRNDNLFDDEIWMKHPIYTTYEASNLGKIRSTNYYHSNHLKEIKQSKVGIGYLGFCIFQDSHRIHFLSHRFIWECFNGLISEDMVIDHIDTNRQNNRIDNLRVCTTKENINNPLTVKKLSQMQTNNPKISKRVIQYSLQGEYIKEYPSTMEIQRLLGFRHSTISNCCNGRVKTAYGFIWHYADS